MDRVRPAQRGVHGPQARVLRLLPRYSERSRGIACAHTRKLAVREAAAGTSQHGLAPKERGLSLVQWPFIGHEPTTTSAVRRARAASARAGPTPPQRASAVAQTRVRTRAFGLCGRPRLERCTTVLHRRKEASRWCSALLYGMNRVQPARRGVRGPQARVLRLLPTESERSGAIACAHTCNRAVRETAAGTSQHGLAPKERGPSLVQWPFV